MDHTVSWRAYIFLAIVLCLHIVGRIYFFQDHLFFQDEQARDYTVVHDAWTNWQPIYLGPIQAETGGIKLGPLYYYLLLPFLVMFQFHPVGGTIMVTLLWLCTLGLVFVYSYKRAGPALAVSLLLFLSLQENFFLYTSIPLNTGIVFLFEAIFIIGLLEWIRTKKERYFVLTIVGLACLLQAQLTAFVLLPFLFFVCWWLRKNVSMKSVVAWLIIPASYLPVFIFDWSHYFQQSKTWLWFIFFKHSVSQLNDSFSFLSSLKVWLISSLISHNALQFYNRLWLNIFMFLFVGFFLFIAVYSLFKFKDYSRMNIISTLKKNYLAALFSLFTFFILLGNTIIHTSKPRHYLLLFFIPYLALAAVFSNLWKKSIASKTLVALCLAIFLIGNILNLKFELTLPGYYEKNKTTEGFSNLYQEQDKLANSIANYIQTSNKNYKLRTSPEHLKGVMKYLIHYHAEFQPLFTPRQGRPDRIIFISYQQPLLEHTPILFSEHFYVYELTPKAYQKIK